jgi:hypothetical protein
MLRLKHGGHDIGFDADRDFAGHLHRALLGNAEGGYVLLRFDVDDNPATVVHVESPGGWWPDDGKAPADLVRRAAEYLGVLSAKLDAIDALEGNA